MAMPERSQRAARDKGRAPAPARRSLTPPDPMPGWLAVVQVLLLLGIPIVLLLLARLVLEKFFPALGY